MLSEESLARMMAPQITTAAGRMGLGFYETKLAGTRFVGHDGRRSSGVTGPAVTKVIAILGFGPLPPSSACSRRASYRGVSCRTPVGDLIFPLSNADRPSAAVCRDGRRLPSSVEPIGGRPGPASQRLREATSTGNSPSLLLTSRVLGRRANSGAIEGEAAPAETKNTTRPESSSSSRRT